MGMEEQLYALAKSSSYTLSSIIGTAYSKIEIKPYVKWSLKEVKTKKTRRQPRNVVAVASESSRLQEVPTVLMSRGTAWTHCYAFI